MIVKLSNKAALSILLLFSVLLTLTFAGAYTKSLGVIPNPGHPLAEIQGYFQGDLNLEDSLDKLNQKKGVLGGGTERSEESCAPPPPIGDGSCTTTWYCDSWGSGNCTGTSGSHPSDAEFYCDNGTKRHVGGGGFLCLA